MTEQAAESLDQESFVPLYFQLQELLKEKIEIGTWKPGEAIPSEAALCEAFGVSRTVVRQALAILEQDGQVRRARGRGTFVESPKIEQRAGGVSRILSVRSVGSELAVLDLREQPASKRIADQLMIEPGAPILRLMTLLRVGGKPVALFDSFFPAAEAGTLSSLKPRSVIALAGAPPIKEPDFAHTSVAIETSFCSKWEAEQLQIPFHGAVFVTLCIEHRHDGASAKPFEVARAVYRVDRVQFRLDVSRDGAVPQATWQLAAEG